MANANALPRETLIDKINKLVKFYEEFKPDAGQRIEVAVSPKHLAKALGQELPKDGKGKPIQQREWPYRGRTIVAIGAE